MVSPVRVRVSPSETALEVGAFFVAATRIGEALSTAKLARVPNGMPKPSLPPGSYDWSVRRRRASCVLLFEISHRLSASSPGTSVCVLGDACAEIQRFLAAALTAKRSDGIVGVGIKRKGVG